MKNITIILIVSATMVLPSCGRKKSSDEKQAREKSPTTEFKKDRVVTIQQQSEADTLKGSLKAEAIGKIGNTEIRISYYSPAMRDRIIWGGLVAYDKVWVTGAHKATSIQFNNDLEIGGKVIPPGKYALFTIPGKEEWIIIINKNWQQHLTDDYNAKEDVVRIKVKPEKERGNQERLRYVIEGVSNSGGEVVVYWEKLEISLPFNVR